MDICRNKKDKSWDVLTKYIMKLFLDEDKNIPEIFERIQKMRCANYFRNENDLKEWIMRTIEPNRYKKKK